MNVIVGAMYLVDGKAPFDRACLVVKSGEGQYTFPGRDSAPQFGEAELVALERSGQFWRFSVAVTPHPKLALWAFRRNFVDWSAFVAQLGGVLEAEIQLPDGGHGCLVRETPAALVLRDHWATASAEASKQDRMAGRYEAALALAAQAFSVSRVVTRERIELYAEALEAAGNHERAEGMRAFGARYS